MSLFPCYPHFLTLFFLALDPTLTAQGSATLHARRDVSLSFLLPLSAPPVCFFLSLFLYLFLSLLTLVSVLPVLSFLSFPFFTVFHFFPFFSSGVSRGHHCGACTCLTVVSVVFITCVIQRHTITFVFIARVNFCADTAAQDLKGVLRVT